MDFDSEFGVSSSQGAGNGTYFLATFVHFFSSISVTGYVTWGYLNYFRLVFWCKSRLSWLLYFVLDFDFSHLLISPSGYFRGYRQVVFCGRALSVGAGNGTSFLATIIGFWFGFQSLVRWLQATSMNFGWDFYFCGSSLACLCCLWLGIQSYSLNM